MSADVGIVFGTYQRLALLQRAVTSIRRSVGKLSYLIVAVDGGSTDGTREWLLEQPDVYPVFQDPPLTGAVIAFNCGFKVLVDVGVRHVATFNDDDEFAGHEGVREIERAVEMLRADPLAGGVAFEMNTRGAWQCEEWAGEPYGNTCLVRREVGMAVARAEGDPTGRAWWDRRFRTYAADTIFGIWVRRLGWKMLRGTGLRVFDRSHPDALHTANFNDYVKQGTANLFAKQFGHATFCQYNRADAERFGGLLR